ncbi:TPA-induced transmembrane protein isoform X2 [Neoarius graeffei]|uniref:TPA-induced transmembrane protein isoform X2 n=1 Tax=Neoarius graeffei TaxID=443677 RepID=UPI00298C09C1|nr:TPA-induced transmembrane protein isoform X2 [Neoarius graeffei]
MELVQTTALQIPLKTAICCQVHGYQINFHALNDAICLIPYASARKRLHKEAESNGAHSTVRIPDDPDEPEGTLGRLKRELNEPACWKLKVWMLILIVFIVLVLVIFLSLYLCSVYKEDVDDKYNVAEFVVPRYFRGNLTLLKNVTLDAQSQSSLQQKLTHIYTSSFALGRYFSLARVKPKRNSNSSAEYELEFKIPKEHEQLIRYTLSKELVYSVLLQQLFDQDTGDPLYIEPSSLTMEVGS